MGEIADMMLDGTFCHQCGGVMPDVDDHFEAPGFPRWCEGCGGEAPRRKPPRYLETARHKCPVARCNYHVSNSHLMCQVHWYMVPKAIQGLVMHAYRRGQTMADATPAWHSAADNAVDAVEFKLIMRDLGRNTEESKRALESAPIGSVVQTPVGSFRKISKTGWIPSTDKRNNTKPL